jgi:hypothetical protein
MLGISVGSHRAAAPDIGERLETFIRELDPKEQEEFLDRFIDTVERIVEDYHQVYAPSDALENAVRDQEAFDREHGNTRISALIDSFVLYRLKFKCLN